MPTGNVHKTAIDCLVWWGVANGRSSTSYAPADGVTRAAMASFIARAIGERDLPAAPRDAFADDDGSVHEHAINQLAAAGIVAGTGNGQFSPGQLVTRGQMARFMANAAAHLGPALPADQDFFDDDAGHLFEPDINRIAQAGITQGRNGRSYEPDQHVNRDQMASFLARLLDLFVERGARSAPAPDNPGDAVDCDDFASQSEAQAYYERYLPHYGDVAKLDPEDDGLACGLPAPGPGEGTVVALWHMDNDDLTMADYSGAGQHGTLTSNVQRRQPGSSGYGYLFDADTSYVSVPSSTALNPEPSAFSVTAHIRFTGYPAGGDVDSFDIVRKGFSTTPGGHWKVEIMASGVAHCVFRGSAGVGSVHGSTDLSDGEWHSIECRRTDNEVTLVVDGVSKTSTVQTGTISNTVPVYLGAKNTLGHDQFRGYLDEVSITKG